MDLAIQVKILDNAVFNPFCTNALEKGSNSTLLPPAISK